MKKITSSANMFFGSMMVMKSAKQMMKTLKGGQEKSRVFGSSENNIEGIDTRKSEVIPQEFLKEVIMEIADNPDEELSPKERISSDGIILNEVVDSIDGTHQVEFLQLKLKPIPVKKKGNLDLKPKKLNNSTSFYNS